MIFLSILRQDDDLAAALLQQWRPLLPDDLIRPTRSRVGEALLRDLLTTWMGIPATSYQLIRESSGRPILLSAPRTTVPPTISRFPAISLTHSGGWIGCAASTFGDVGLDLECAKAGRDVSSLAQAAFGPQEIAAVRAGGEEAFYRIWTLREARSKARGDGFSSVIDHQDHVPHQSAPNFMSTSVAAETWHWLTVELLRGLHLGLALRQTSANHSTVQLRKCHVSPELTFNWACFDALLSSDDTTAPIGIHDATT